MMTACAAVHHRRLWLCRQRRGHHHIAVFTRDKHIRLDLVKGELRRIEKDVVGDEGLSERAVGDVAVRHVLEQRVGGVHGLHGRQRHADRHLQERSRVDDHITRLQRDVIAHDCGRFDRGQRLRDARGKVVLGAREACRVGALQQHDRHDGELDVGRNRRHQRRGDDGGRVHRSIRRRRHRQGRLHRCQRIRRRPARQNAPTRLVQRLVALIVHGLIVRIARRPQATEQAWVAEAPVTVHKEASLVVAVAVTVVARVGGPIHGRDVYVRAPHVQWIHIHGEVRVSDGRDDDRPGHHRLGVRHGGDWAVRDLRRRHGWTRYRS
ncbi:hypothetical protein H257_09499 [Aphanomyces astaci]|uniref:Uncharacterized protein n=1 Tax=Aphanomyces astaci TaxID=112090 RepID=W4GBZ4_APHAT|nr:hypothetical protein H257_09499 [Aphanomyces astaci]ETV76483.1 hypothetical protein H257_09499 [Aphanomyces astaci]|eukprot:XP_009834028.1 hypothetical protein H257_09499 [Aphanomyces astaci]